MKSVEPIALFHRAAREIPAYAKFLTKFGVNPKNIQAMEDFRALPIMDKQNYIYAFPFLQRFPKNTFPAMAYASSGSSGKPTFWFGNDEYEAWGGENHERIFHDIFHIKKSERTLVIISFSMGVWIAGHYTLASVRSLARHGYKITAITPGIEKEDISSILKDLAPSFRHVILAGYPPFLMDVLRNIPISLTSFYLLASGDKFSEKWRKDALVLMHAGDPFHAIINVYGCADAALLGHETPFTIFFRRLCNEHPEILAKLTGKEHTILPAIVQYNPAHIFFEELKGELLLSAYTPAPLIRYNVHDVGSVFSYLEMREFLRKEKILDEACAHEFNKWPSPFLVVSGRSDVAVTFYALKIPAEHLKIALADARLTKILSGNFFAYSKDANREHGQRLFLNLELRPNVKTTENLRAQVLEIIVEVLQKLNIEYRKLRATIGNESTPVITLFPYGSDQLKPARQGLLNIRGKKPRIAL